MANPLFLRLCDEIDHLETRALAGQPLSSTEIHKTAQLLRELKERLEDLDQENCQLEVGEPDDAENRRVSAALHDAGSIRGASELLGITPTQIKLLIIQHKVTWPR